MIDTKTVAVIAQDTYNFNNSTIFYSLINSAFLPYYQRVIRKSQQWLDGYDPAFHKDDMFSTRIASKLFNGLASQIFGRGIVFIKGKNNVNEENKALDFISHKWSDKSDFQNAVKQLIGYTLPLGVAVLKLNKGIDGLWVQPIRADYFYFSTDSRKKISSITTFIRAWQSTENREENYFLVEKRYFKVASKTFIETINGKKVEFKANERVPMCAYKVYKYMGMVTNDTMPASVNDTNDTNFKNLPEWIRTSINQDYSNIMIGKEMPLPFKDYLGVELFLNEGGDITNPTLPMGRALVFDCLSDFMEYDMDKSYSIRDDYNSKGIVGLPKSLSQSQVIKDVPGTGGNMTQNSAFGQLDIPGYEIVPGLDPSKQQPIVTQFEIRAAEHETKQNAILKSLAFTISLPTKIIASYLIQGTQQTDDQIQSEDDSAVQWIKNHRQDYICGLNHIIECVLNFNGYSNNVECRFASDGLIKGDKQLESIQKRMDMNLLTLDDAIRELYPDLDEEQLQEKIAKAQNQKLQQQQDEANKFDDTFGNFKE